MQSTLPAPVPVASIRQSRRERLIRCLSEYQGFVFTGWMEQGVEIEEALTRAFEAPREVPSHA